MHNSILTDEQRKLLPPINIFSKDYVDLYFVLKDYHDLRKISSKAAEIFGNSFNAKLLREQLCYFDDIDYSEKVEYVGEEVDDETIKILLTDIATKRFD